MFIFCLSYAYLLLILCLYYRYLMIMFILCLSLFILCLSFVYLISYVYLMLIFCYLVVFRLIICMLSLDASGQPGRYQTALPSRCVTSREDHTNSSLGKEVKNCQELLLRHRKIAVLLQGIHFCTSGARAEPCHLAASEWLGVIVLAGVLRFLGNVWV